MRMFPHHESVAILIFCAASISPAVVNGEESIRHGDPANHPDRLLPIRGERTGDFVISDLLATLAQRRRIC